MKNHFAPYAYRLSPINVPFAPEAPDRSICSANNRNPFQNYNSSRGNESDCLHPAYLHHISLQISHIVILRSVVDNLSSFYHRYFGGCYTQILLSISIYFMILDILFSNYLYPDILEKKDCHPTLQV